MRCGECGGENAGDRRFCADCGAALSAACAACGFQNQPGARFCGGCGARLARDEPADRPAPERAGPAAEGERRQVTILFADLTGFTELSAELDAEDVHALVGRFFEAADGIVEHYGGTVDKHIGDAVMALFGAPIAHGDDPLRALRAAFDIHRAARDLGAGGGRDLTVHAGIASGEVVAGGMSSDGRGDYTVLGESVNLAARLVDSAAPGETLIADAVRRAVSGQVECEDLGAVTVKGFERPVRVWRARGLRAGAADAVRAPFVGRRGELRQACAVLEACRESGAGQVVLVRGEAGIGKTRLVEEFMARAEHEGFACHKGLVLDFGVGRGQDAIRALTRSLLDAQGAGASDGAAAAERAVAAGWVRDDDRVFLNDLLDLAQPTELRSLYDAMDNATRNRGKQAVVAGLVKAASARGPLLIVVEDVHWAEPVLLAHLASTAAATRDCPAVLVMTTRVEADPLDSAWRSATGGTPLATIDLGPLRPEEALTLARGFIDASTQTAVHCVERAEGNPLFLEQLLRNAEESGSENVPASVQSLVLARMDRLDEADKKALQAASAIGQRFALAPLRHLISDPGYACDRLIEHYLVRPEGEDYLFAHALIQEGAYASLLKRRRRDLHRRAAAWFAERDPALHAEHLDRAEDPAAPRAYLAAAKARAEAYHYDRALELIKRGLALADDAPDLYALTCAQGSILLDVGSVPESVAAYEAALGLAADDGERSQAWIGLAEAMRVSSNFEGAFAALEKAEPVATAQGATLALAQIHHIRGNLCFPLGRISECLAEHKKSLDCAVRAGSPHAQAQALSGMGDGEYAHGRMRTAHEYFRRCVELCRAHGFGRIEVANLGMEAITRMYLLDVRGSFEGCLQAVQAARRVGHHRAEVNGWSCLFHSHFDVGPLDESERYADQMAAAIEHLGARAWDGAILSYRSRILDMRGHRREAREVLDQALAAGRKYAAGFYVARVLAQAALLADDAEARRRYLAEGEQDLRRGSLGHNHLWFYRDAIDACLAAGDWDAAERYAAALEDYTRPEPLPWSDYFIARGRALAAWGRGARDGALAGELRRLRDEAVRVGLKTALPALEAALAQAPGGIGRCSVN